MTDTFEEVLTHYGIKGMRWGVRRPEGPDGTVASVAKKSSLPPTDDAIKALTYKKIASTSGTQSLSNDELKLLLTRVDLEAKYSKAFGGNKKKGGKAFVQELLREEGKKQTRSIVSAAATVAVANALAKQASKAGSKALVKGVASKLAVG